MTHRNREVALVVIGAMAWQLPVAALAAATVKKAQAAKPLPPIRKASWIWGNMKDDVCHFRTSFTLEEAPTGASILITADNGYELYVNGVSIGFDVGAATNIWNSLERYDLTKKLTRGINVIGVRGICLGGYRGLVSALRIEVPGQPLLEIVTDTSWQVARKGDPTEYSHPDQVGGPEWSPAKVLGSMGMRPWGKLTYKGSKGGRREGALPSAAAMAEPDADFRWPEGIVFVGEDCSAYKPLRGDVWGVCFRVGNWSRAYTEFDIPCPSKIGRKLYVLRPVGPGAVPRVLVDSGKGAIGSPSVSYDGQFIYAAMALDGESFFHIYRIPAEGGTPERLTEGPFHDIDPAELPDGRIVFASTRIGTFEEYHNPPSRALFVMGPDGSNTEPITFTVSFDNEPKVMADGSIAFIRTDNFFDRAKVETRIHVTRPDGTNGYTAVGAEVGADYGSRLRRFGYGSPAPLPNGELACISNRGNFVCAPGGSETSFHRLPRGLGDLAPLPDGRLLVTVLRPSGRRMNSDVIGVVDPSDNRIVKVFVCPEGSVHSPVFLGTRPRPPVMARTVRRRRAGHPGATGFLYCQNVRATTKTKADWSQVRAIRVLGALGLTTRSSHSHIVHAGHETVELGTVPIATDGSFYVEIPADLPLALQAVDAEGRSELNEMSWIYVRPGERRACVGCHHHRRITPPSDSLLSEALRDRPLRLVGQGRAHRFRGNNSGVTGMMDLQFERFRETASLNLHLNGARPLANGSQVIAALIEQLKRRDEGLRVSAAQRLALFRARSAAPALAAAMADSSREVRVAAALATAACGTRESIPALLGALKASGSVGTQAAAVALENLTAPAESSLGARLDAWQTWLRQNPWEEIEKSLIQRISSTDRATQRRAIVALGHVGGSAGRAALRQYVAQAKEANPYPPFVKNNRTDRFTFSAESPLNPRTLQEGVRGLGYLQDVEALPLLREILTDHTDPKTGNLFLVEATIEALGRIGTDEAEALLIETFCRLQDYVHYVGWYSDHPALYACHASPLHARTIAALDAMGSTRTQGIVPHLIRSVPTDPDRALFPESDTYEVLVGCVILRSGRGPEVIETCLALLGDPAAEAVDDIKQAVSATHRAWAGKPDPDNRAAQVLASVCRDRSYEPRVRAAYERYRVKPEDPIKRPLGNPRWIPQRHWVLFYLGRALGNIGDPRSVDALLGSLKLELNEARHGRPDPSEPNIHFLQLEYTPCWRAAAAWALGQIRDTRAAPVLLKVVENLDNATDTRHAAAEALGQIADPSTHHAIRQLAAAYPEVSTRRALLRAIQARPHAAGQ